MLYRVFRVVYFFAFSHPEFPQLEYGNITKCIQRGKNLKEDSLQEHRRKVGTMGSFLVALHCAVFHNVYTRVTSFVMGTILNTADALSTILY